MQIRISEEVKNLVPSCALGVVRYKAMVEKSSDALTEYFDSVMDGIGSKYITKDIAEMPHIRPTRAAYKALGKDPHSNCRHHRARR